MKRKLSSLDDDETRLAKLLFSNSKELIETFKPLEQQHTSHDLDQKPAWVDEDDDQFSVTDSKTKAQYTEKLKQKYENLIGTPSWAKLHKSKVKSEDQEDENNDILRTVGHIQKKNCSHLPKNFLEIKNLQYINTETRNEGRIISCIEFHPKSSVALVGGNAGIVSLFSIGGEGSNKLHSFKLKKWKVTAAQFSPSGSEAYLASNINQSYCVYDLIKAQPKLTQLPSIIKRPKLFQLSPDGKYIATSDEFDEIYLISSASKELLRALKHNSNVVSLVFSHNSEQLFCYCVQGEITIWDLSTFRPLKKFYDNGCVNASVITTSSCGRLLATGSCEGIINIYETSKLDTTEPLPIKTVTNLTTKISNLKFNATTEILAASSKTLSHAVKLVHIPSYHVYTNYPDMSQSLSRVETVNFSPNSGYMAMGNDRGCAYLYRLKYYKNY